MEPTAGNIGSRAVAKAKPESAEPAARGGRLGLACYGVAAFLVWLLTSWAAAALYFDVRVPELRVPAAIGFLLGVSVARSLVTSRWLKVGFTAGWFLVVLSWWLSLAPSNHRDWQPDVALLAYADIDETRVTLHNIRNCQYRTETDFDVRHYDQSFNLDDLRTADLFLVYWGSPNIAHTMVSFGFTGDRYVCFSIETRKEQGESYSAVRGLFRQFELVYVVGDERDLVRLRTNYRKGEEVYLFRLNGTAEQARQLFSEYLHRLNSLHENPEWYSAVTQNCTTSIRAQRAASDRAPWDWRMLANGHGDELLYERGLINTRLPLPELKRRCHINQRAKAADQAEDFSTRIRQEIPGIDL